MRPTASEPSPGAGRTSIRMLVLALTLALGAAQAGPAEPAPMLPAPAGGIRPLNVELDGRWIGNAVSYGPYRRGQSPDGAKPTDAQLLEDLRIMAGHWNLFRMYGSSPESARVLRLIREHRLPLRMLLGAWITPEVNDTARAANREQVASAIRLANEYRDIVIAVNVGNETQVYWSWHRSPPEVLIAHLRTVRAAIRQPVATADDVDFWSRPEARVVAAECDFIIMHAYALWNSQPLAEAMAWTAGKYELVRELYPSRTVVIGETGWATSHSLNKPGPGGETERMKAEISVAAQAEYLRQHNRWVDRHRVVTFLFEAFDEPWKGSGSDPGEAEKNWGVFYESRQPKPSLRAIQR